MLHVLIEEIHLFVQVLDRGEKIELLVDKTENLRSQVSPRKSLLEMNWLQKTILFLGLDNVFSLWKLLDWSMQDLSVLI